MYLKYIVKLHRLNFLRTQTFLLVILRHLTPSFALSTITMTTRGHCITIKVNSLLAQSISMVTFLVRMGRKHEVNYKYDVRNISFSIYCVIIYPCADVNAVLFEHAWGREHWHRTPTLHSADMAASHLDWHRDTWQTHNPVWEPGPRMRQNDTQQLGGGCVLLLIGGKRWNLPGDGPLAHIQSRRRLNQRATSGVHSQIWSQLCSVVLVCWL